MAVPSENAVCFLHGLQELFLLIGGVPRVIRFDNLSPVVAKILSPEDRSLTELFKWHYRFQAEFCNPGRGQEKGHVEKKVGYVRQNSLSPVPIIDELCKSNRTLHGKMIADRERKHYSKGVLISELWEDDRRNLLPLPERPMDIFQFFARIQETSSS